MMQEFFLPGIVIGVAAALTPGPVFLVQISETLQKGLRAGLSVAISPLLVDIILVPVAVFGGDMMRAFSGALAVLSFLGAGLLAFLGFKNLRVRSINVHKKSRTADSLITGVLTDFLGPFVYVFWFSVGLPVFAKGDLLEDVVFALTLSFSAVVCNAIIVLAVFRMRERFVRYIPVIVRALGICLILMALLFVKEGVGYLQN